MIRLRNVKFHFSKNLDYQLDAIKAVVGVFDTGQNFVLTPYQNEKLVLQMLEAVVANGLDLDGNRLLQNIQAIQRQNKIDSLTEKLDSLDFSIEMETGTGKTYVYLRTIMELNQKYGLKKFIILVPSVAIREGVIKTIQQTKEHFRELYNTNFGYFAYDSGKLTQVRDFARSMDIQIMIMTIQSFNSDTRVLRQEDRDDTYVEKSYLSLIAKTRPVVVMDEPQNMESELAKSSIGELQALFRLRYSATHKEIHNLLYRLTPVDAYRKGLVKKISVLGVRDDDSNDLVFKVKELITKKGESPKAKVLLEIKNAAGDFVKEEKVIKVGDDLESKTKNSKYKDLDIRDIDGNFKRVELSNGTYYFLEAENENKEEIFRTQIRETIKAHFEKQIQLGEQIKVLSLFFIDRVANYTGADSLIKKIFCEEFVKISKNYPRFKDVDVEAVHKGYFASKKEKGQVVFQDTKGDSKIDKDAYDLIMKDKERLLSFAEPVSFIFSHSALKEGWDNPNIFQICTLKETQSVTKKRQEIGRGLRLPVDINGERVYDEKINVLTVVANESYQEYVAGLQTEFTKDGYGEKLETTNAKEKPVTVKTTKLLASDDFIKLWERISQRTKFNLQVDTEALIKNSVEKINQLDVKNLVVTVDKVELSFGENDKIQTVYSKQSAGERLKREIYIPNVLERITVETGLTKKTIAEILGKVENLNLIFKNPEEYIRSVVVYIKQSLHDLLVNTGLEYIPTGEFWEIKLLFSDFEALASKSIKSEKSVFDRTLWDSDGERKFAQSLENSSNVRVYTKFPRRFRIDTPLGEYIPDWAIVMAGEDGDILYLVRETKFGYKNLEEELSKKELQKIFFAQKHFEAIGFDNFRIAEATDLSDLVHD